MSVKPICFYHKADLDGVCSGAIVKHFVPDCELHGSDYGDLFPWGKVQKVVVLDQVAHFPGYEAVGSEKRTVYMVDFSLPLADMKRLAEVSNLVWIDHHKTAIDEYDKNMGFGVPHETLLQEGWAACELCWYYFTGADLDDPGKQVPEAVRLLGSYDVWRKDDKEWASRILPFQYGMRTEAGIYDPLCETWESLLDPPDEFGFRVEDRVLTGTAILRYQAEGNRKACEAGAHDVPIKAERWFDKDGTPAAFSLCRRDLRGERIIVKALACNTTTHNSLFFDGFYDPEKHDVMCAYCQLKDGRWKVSLYSTKATIDCGAIAKAFGGGGHKGAAGYVSETLGWVTEEK